MKNLIKLIVSTTKKLLTDLILTRTLKVCFKRKKTNETKFCKKLFSTRRFYTLYEQKFSNLSSTLSITFPQGFQNKKKSAHWTLGSGGNRPLKGVRNTKTKKILLRKATFAKKITFFVTIFYPLLVNFVKSETTSFPCICVSVRCQTVSDCVSPHLYLH